VREMVEEAGNEYVTSHRMLLTSSWMLIVA